MVMLLLSFLCHGILQLKNTRLGLFPHNYRRPEKKDCYKCCLLYCGLFGAQLICQMEQQPPPWKYKLFALSIIIAAAEKLYQNATRYDDIKALISAFRAPFLPCNLIKTVCLIRTLALAHPGP